MRQGEPILDEELTGISNKGTPCDTATLRCREEKTHRKHEGDDSANAADERELCGERTQCYECSDSDFDRSDKIGNELKAEKR